jgi:hypothetical protein
LAPGLALAQLAECRDISSASDSFKVVLDELTAVDTGLENLKKLMAISLSFQLQEIQKEIDLNSYRPAIGLGVVTCLNRKPSLSGAEFTPARIESLNDQRVVVELWGTLLASSDGPAGAPRATIGYVIPPVLHYQSEPAISGRYLIQYPKGGGTAADDLQKLPEASAFALLGLAVKARKAQKYELAVWAFERSAASIRAAKGPQADVELDQLLSYVQLAACQTREAARADLQYHGTLTLLPKETCKVSP